jgi:hypothetical protein
MFSVNFPSLYPFYMGLGLNYLDGGKYITRATGRVELENLNFFGPKWHSL